MKIQRVANGLVALLLATLAMPGARAGYGIVDLGVLPGGSLSAGSAINNAGVVAGAADNAQGNTNAFRSSSDGPVNLMTLPGGRFSSAYGINDGGTVVGVSDMRVGQNSWQSRAFRMESGGSMQDLGVPRDAIASYATGINNGGLISGYAVMGDGRQVGFVSTGPGSFTLLDSFRPDGSSIAHGINGSGQIVGAAETIPGVFRAFVTTAGGPLVDLGTLGGPWVSSFATAINDGGRIVGYSGETGSYRAFRTRADGSLEDLGNLFGAYSMHALAINGLAQVVGSANFGGGSSRAFLYTDLEGLIDLNLKLEPGSGWILTSASGINDKGQITGTGLYQGQARAYLLDPNSAVVPEPSAAVLVGIGLVALVSRRRGRSRG